MSKIISFGDQIRNAKSEDIVKKLLEESKKLTDATDKTRRRWKRLATERINSINSPVQKTEVIEHVSKPIETKRLRKKDRAVKENASKG